MKKDDKQDMFDDLRRRSKDKLEKMTAEQPDLSKIDIQKTIEELRIYQIELEMQNDQLRQSQKDLEESRASYADLFDYAPAGYFVFDKNGVVINVNLTACDMLRLEREDIIGKPFNFYITQNDKKSFSSHRQSVIKAFKNQSCELRLIAKDKSEFYVNMQSKPLRNPHKDDAVQCWSSIIDITEQKQAERRQIFLNEVLTILNNSLTIADAINGTLSAIKKETGFDAVGIRLRSGEDFPYFSQEGFSDDFMLKENSLLNRDISGGLCRNEDGSLCFECTCGVVISGKGDPSNPLFTPEGSFWTNDSFPLLDIPPEDDPRLNPRNECIHKGYASVALIPIRQNQEIVGLLQLNDMEKNRLTIDMIQFFEGLCTAIGMTLMRKRAEEELKRQRYFLEKAQQLGNIGSWQLDIGKNKLTWSDQNYRIFGLPIGTELTYETFLGQVHPEDRRYVDKKWKAALGGRPYDLEHRLLIEGNVKWVREKADLEFDQDGNCISATGFTHDITGKKLAEQDREYYLRKLQDKTEEMEHFLAVIRHDLGNPLMSIQAFSIDLARSAKVILDFIDKLDIDQGIRQKLIPILTDRVPSSVEYIEMAVKQMNSILEGLRKVADLGRVPVKTQALDTNKVIEETTILIKSLLDQSKASVTAEQLPQCLADPEQLKQVFSNLLTNAIKYCHPERKPQVHISGYIEDDRSVYCLADNGKGMTEAQQRKAFDAFYRVSNDTEGQGLGLTIVAKILDRQQGSIWVESEPGEGTRFYIALPKG